MIRKCICLLTFISCILWGISATAQDSGLDILTIGPGTHALGLNEAVTAELIGPSSLYSNPANLALEQSSSLNTDYTLWIGDLTHTRAGINMRKNSRALAFGFISSQTSDIPLRENQPGPADGSFNISSLSISGGYAYQVGQLSVGATLQYLREEYYIHSASGYAANIGLAGQFWDDRLQLGATLLNLGMMNELQNESTKLPTTFNTGFSLDLFSFSPPKNEDLPISVALKNDIVFPLQESQQTTQENSSQEVYTIIAVELLVAEIIALRSGYKTGQTVRPWSAGLGIEIDSITANYALIPFETGFGTVHSLGINYQF